MADDPVVSWLMEGDPSIRWQVLRDLDDASPVRIEAERTRVAKEGWGKNLLGLQETDGRWGGGLYSPKWISTTYTLLLLEQLGLEDRNEAAAAGAALLVEAGLGDPASDVCVIGMVLKLVSRFLDDATCRDQIVETIADRRLGDGGWNCRDVRGDTTHSSLHTTINILEGLAAARQAGATRCDPLLTSGKEFLLQHHLYRSHRTGEVIRSDMTRFSFPPRWWFDVLRGLDHFQAVDAGYDDRMEDAMGLLMAKRLSDGTWKLQNRHTGRTFFEMEQVGKPSRWNTLRALRVSRWWDALAN